MSNPEGFEQPVAGWYPDPESGAMRWWDGQQWGAFQDVAGNVPMTAAGAQPAQVSVGDPRQQAALAHYLGVLGFIGPLIIYVTSGDKDPFVKDQSTEALNFHLTVLIGWLVVSVISVVTCGIGILLFPVLWIAELAFSVVGGMHASKGEWYRYPFNIRMVKSGAPT